MKGHRIHPSHAYEGAHELEPGEYLKDNLGHWVAKTPNGLVANLRKHTIVEHEDRTITVTPSIACSDSNLTWHGFLEHGIWREC